MLIVASWQKFPTLSRYGTTKRTTHWIVKCTLRSTGYNTTPEEGGPLLARPGKKPHRKTQWYLRQRPPMTGTLVRPLGKRTSVTPAPSLAVTGSWADTTHTA